MRTEDHDKPKNQYLPERFGRYIVNDRIGLGGFASVYSALDPELNSTVAVKVLADNHSADNEIRRRFLEEARVARQIASDRLVNVYDVGQTDDARPYVVMQLADRGTLGDRLAEVMEPTARDLRILISEMSTCLKAIHDRNIVHRDIKPSNLLLISLQGNPEDTSGALIRTDERVVLADFGLARDISGGVSGMTIAGGTAGYMAPEQLRPDGQPDRRADLYAASAIIAAIACGVHPERLNLAESDLPNSLKEVLTAQLSIDPDDRPDSATAWSEQLLEAFDHHQVQETAEIQQADVDEALAEIESWNPPSQPPEPVIIPPRPPANSWNPPQTTSGGSFQGTSDQYANNYAPHGFSTPQAGESNYVQHNSGQAPGNPSASVGFMRGIVGLSASFVLLYLLVLIAFLIEGEAGAATKLGIAIATIGPMVCFFLGMRYLSWPRARN